MGKRIFVFGDAHGCVDELRMLLDCVQFSGNDRLISAGDLIDRGPSPVGVIQLLRSLGGEGVMGNHEEKALRYRRHSAKRAENPNYVNPMGVQHPDRLKQWNAIPDEDWDWLAFRPKFIHINKWWTVVHGGCEPGIDVELQKENVLMRMRYYDTAKKKMVSPTPSGGRPDSCHHWSDIWDGERKIVYGHYTFDDVKVTHNTLGIDTGCYSGGPLTAAEFNEDNDQYKIHQVASGKVYHPRRWGNDAEE